MRIQTHTFLIQPTTVVLALCAILLSADRASAQNKFVMDDNQFNGWLFQGSGQLPDKESEITLMVEAIDRSCHLSAEQKEKLRLAGNGDYARFDEKVSDLRAECVGKTFDQNEMQELYQKFQPLQEQYQAGMLGRTSLFAKVVQQSLTPEQREEFEATEAERRKARHTAKVRLFVALFEQSCPLKAAQRAAIVDLLLKETRPALRSSEYDWYVIIVQAAKISDAKWNPILDKAQLTYIKKITGQARGIEGHLKQIGVLPK